MNNNNGGEPIFSKESLADGIRLWEHAAISLVDIRHDLISAEDAVRGYQLPASTFLYTSGGKAEVSLDETTYSVERFGLFHGGRGTELSIRPMDNWLEYYMVLYKAGEAPFHKSEFIRLLERINPFRQQYGFVPDNPLFFAEQLRKMFQRWKSPTSLNLFYGKAAFYQLVYEVYEELEKGHILLRPDIVAMAKRFMDRHYSQEINIQSLCAALSISRSQFYKRFTAQEGKNPQKYLIDIRLSKVRKYLTETECSLKEIAGACGFSDEFILMRTFRSRFNMTAIEYRNISAYQSKQYTIGNLGTFLYNEQDRVSLDKLRGEGARYMFKQMRSKAIMAAALSLLLLSACGTGAPANTDGPQAAPLQAVTTQAPEAAANVEAAWPKTFVDATGSEIVWEKKPERIVLPYGFFAEDFFALNEYPLGMGGIEGFLDSFIIFQPYLSDKNHPIEEVAPRSMTPDVEKLIALEPELIIIPEGFQGGSYDHLTKIAPTITIDLSLSWKDRLREFAHILGKEAEAEEYIAAIESDIESYREQLAKRAGETVLMLSATDSKTFYPGSTAYYSHLYDTASGLGLAYPEGLTSEGGAASLEGIAELDPDHILYFYGAYYDVNTVETYEELQESAVWNSLSAVKNGNVHLIDIGGTGGALAVRQDIEAVFEALN